MSKFMMIIVKGIAAICAELLTVPVVAGDTPMPGTTDAPPPAETGDAVDLDSLHLPWDSRINSSGKTKYKSDSGEGKPGGSWVLKKGAKAPTAALLAQVRSELRIAQQGPLDKPSVDETGGAPDAPPADDTAGAPDAPPVDEVMGFKEFVVKMSTQKPPFTAEQLTEACLMNGLGNIKELKDNPSSIPGVVDSLWPTEGA